MDSYGIKFSVALAEMIHKHLKSEMVSRSVHKKHLTEENITTDFPGKPDERWTKNERYKKHVKKIEQSLRNQDVLQRNPDQRTTPRGRRYERTIRSRRRSKAQTDG